MNDNQSPLTADDHLINAVAWANKLTIEDDIKTNSGFDSNLALRAAQDEAMRGLIWHCTAALVAVLREGRGPVTVETKASTPRQRRSGGKS